LSVPPTASTDAHPAPGSTASRRLRVEPISSVAALQGLAAEWQQLFRESGVALPFMTFEWIDSWWQHMRTERRTVRDTLAMRALRTESGRLVAVAPFVRTQRPSIGPV